MDGLISLSIDVTKIDKSRLYVGKKGTYLKITVGVNPQPNEHGLTASVWEEQTKEEREAKADRNFLGGGKVVFDKLAPLVPVPAKASGPRDYDPDDLPDDLPF